MRNCRTVVARINDRGPFNKGLTIDVTPAAARELHFPASRRSRSMLSARHSAPPVRRNARRECRSELGSID
jgi:rare lipoprotein A (peptidoglycan hydrolase)